MSGINVGKYMPVPWSVGVLYIGAVEKGSMSGKYASPMECEFGTSTSRPRLQYFGGGGVHGR